MNKLIFLFPFIILSGCEKPVADGVFVGQWYALNYFDGQKHWTVNDRNEVLIRDTINDTLLEYKLRYNRLNESYYMISANLKDTIGFSWIENPNKFPPERQPDTIRFYHSFTLIRNNKPPKTNFSNKKILEILENNYWQFDVFDTEFNYLLTDSLLENNEKRKAHIKLNGCFDYYSKNGHWTLDTLTNNLVLKIRFTHFEENLFIKKINENSFQADRDEFYWFRKNIDVKRASPSEKQKTKTDSFSYIQYYDCF